MRNHLQLAIVIVYVMAHNLTTTKTNINFIQN